MILSLRFHSCNIEWGRQESSVCQDREMRVVPSYHSIQLEGEINAFFRHVMTHKMSIKHGPCTPKKQKVPKREGSDIQGIVILKFKKHGKKRWS